jgi:hypothetical protein
MSGTGDSAFEGHAPSIRIDGPTLQEGHSALVGNGEMTEREKYAAMWTHPQYRTVAPGESVAQLFLAQAKPRPGSEVIDFGTGTGRGALMLALLGNMKVRMLDFADNCLDEDVRQMLTTQAHAMCFAQQDLTDPIPWTAEYGFCTDVMEHIPPKDVDTVLINILKASQHVFFQISCEDDVCGALIGQPLHLSVHDYKWWHDKLQTEFECQIHWSQDNVSHCLFYVTAWMSGRKMTDAGVLNVEEQQVLENVKRNIRRGLQQVVPHQANDTEIVLLGGGPSLNDHLADIRRLVAAGAKVATLNGAYNWAVERGLQVGAQIMVDARPFNKRFVEPVQDGCKYFLASQCDPSVYDSLEQQLRSEPIMVDDGGGHFDDMGSELPDNRIYQWHTSADFITEALKEVIDPAWRIWGGSTVLLRGIPLLRTLGFKKFHLFGCDSCILSANMPLAGEVSEAIDPTPVQVALNTGLWHHAYAQPENDNVLAIKCIIGGRTFNCHAWMFSQASEFVDLIRVMGDEIELEVYGNGLLAWILQYGHDRCIEIDLEYEIEKS